MLFTTSWVSSFSLQIDYFGLTYDLVTYENKSDGERIVNR